MYKKIQGNEEMKKSQSAIELIIIIGAMMFIFTVLLATFQQNINDKTRQKRVEEFNDLALNIQNEIAIASAASEGYKRTFTIPERVYGHDYTITVNEDFLFLETTDKKTALGLTVQPLTGQLQIGDNIIEKQNGVVLLNQ